MASEAFEVIEEIKHQTFVTDSSKSSTTCYRWSPDVQGVQVFKLEIIQFSESSVIKEIDESKVFFSQRYGVGQREGGFDGGGYGGGGGGGGAGLRERGYSRSSGVYGGGGGRGKYSRGSRGGGGRRKYSSGGGSGSDGRGGGGGGGGGGSDGAGGVKA